MVAAFRINLAGESDSIAFSGLNVGKSRSRVALGLALLCGLLLGSPLTAMGLRADIHLMKIDAGVSWVSSYWGYNAPKLVHDGEYFYTIGSWGENQETSSGVVYRYDGMHWVRGHEWSDLDYQPGMLLLDSQKRLVVVYSRKGSTPVILRGIETGTFTEFEPLPVPGWLNPAGYLGAGIYEDVIVLGYTGDPATYSFNYAAFDMEQATWSGPFLVAPAQRQEEPFTTWLYPIIHPHADGIRMTVSNGRDSSNLKHEILSLDLPYVLTTPAAPELVDAVTPWDGRICQAASMHLTSHGSSLVAGQYHEGAGGNTLSVWRKSIGEREWQRHRISTGQIGAIFQAPSDETLWLMSTSGAALKLYSSIDDGMSWQEAPIPSIAQYELVSTFFLYGINTSSGSVIPKKPTAVFSAGRHPDYELWFVQFDTSQEMASAGANGLASD